MITVATAALLLTGCSGGDEAATTPSPKPTTATAETAVAPPPPPATRACYDLDLAEAAEATSDAEPVPCRRRHTAVTIHVGALDPVADGHLLAIDSDRVQRQAADRCRARLAGFVGGDEETRRLSRLTVVWFTPTLEESDRGARWFRCDLVAPTGGETLAPLPRRARGVLDAEDALDRWGTCGTTSPASKRFTRVLCSSPHTWRARSTITLPPGTKYLGKAARATADSTCRDVAARLAADVLRLQWSFEWPTREQWDAGQRYGYCWTPAT